MADQVLSGEMAFPAATSIGQYLRVKGTTTIQDGLPVVAVAGATDVTVGVTQRACFTTTGPVGQTVNTSVTVRLASASGTIIMTANGTINVASAGPCPVYSAANGKVSASQGSGASLVGYALTSTTADGDLLTVLPV